MSSTPCYRLPGGRKQRVLFCAEDMGLADPDAIVLVNAVWSAYQHIPDNLGKQGPIDEKLAVEALLYLAHAPKHGGVDTAKNWMLERRANAFKSVIPDYTPDCHTQRGKHLGKTELDWWNDDAWLPACGYGKYEFDGRLKRHGGTVPPEDEQPSRS